MEKISKVIGPKEEGERLDIVLAGWIDSLSRTSVQKLIESGEVLLNGEKKKSSYRVKPGDHVLMERPRSSEEGRLAAQEIPLEVVYEDRHLIVVDKPQGIVVHPGPGHPDGTLVNALLGRSVNLPDVGGKKRPGIVHRLDKDTSGAILVVKTKKAYRSLKEQFKQREVKKEYIALVEGSFEEDTGTIEAPIGRSRKDKTSRKVTMDGKNAATNFAVKKSFSDTSLLSVFPLTGRTHQIRVHFKYIGHPVVGDRKYGAEKDSGLMLHALRLGVNHPESKERVTFETEIPERFESYFSE